MGRRIRRNIFKARTKDAECPHRLTTKRMKTVRQFLKKFLQNPHAYGAIGSSSWIHSLLKEKFEYRKLSHDKCTAHDVRCWLRETNNFKDEIARLENGQNASHAELQVKINSPPVATATVTTTAPTPNTTTDDGGMGIHLESVFSDLDELFISASSSRTNQMAASSSSAPALPPVLSFENLNGHASNEYQGNTEPVGSQNIPPRNLEGESALLHAQDLTERTEQPESQPVAGPSWRPTHFESMNKIIPIEDKGALVNGVTPPPAEEDEPVNLKVLPDDKGKPMNAPTLLESIKVEPMETEEIVSNSILGSNGNADSNRGSKKLPTTSAFDLKTRISIRRLIRTVELLKEQPKVKTCGETSLVLEIVADLLGKIDPAEEDC